VVRLVNNLLLKHVIQLMAKKHYPRVGCQVRCFVSQMDGFVNGDSGLPRDAQYTSR